MTQSRALFEIANEIARLWTHVNYAAVPYLEAMHELHSINDMCMNDNARGIVLYFLSNASGWRGSDARRIKSELKGILK